MPDGELTSDGGVQPVEVGERKRYRAEVHHDPAHVAGTATRHEDAGVTAPDVTTAGIVRGDVDGDVQRALDRPLDAHVHHLSMPKLFHLSSEDVVRLAHLLHEHRVVPDCRRQVRPTFQQLASREAGRRQTGTEDHKNDH